MKIEQCVTLKLDKVDKGPLPEGTERRILVESIAAVTLGLFLKMEAIGGEGLFYTVLESNAAEMRRRIESATDGRYKLLDVPRKPVSDRAGRM